MYLVVGVLQQFVNACNDAAKHNQALLSLQVHVLGVLYNLGQSCRPLQAGQLCGRHAPCGAADSVQGRSSASKGGYPWGPGGGGGGVGGGTNTMEVKMNG